MLRRLIAHQIIKEQHKTTASVFLRDKVLPVESELAVSLLDQLSDSFIKRSPVTGRFKSTEMGQPPFQQKLLSYLGDASDSSFVNFTKKAAERLKDGMAKQSLASGGYTIFAEYVDDKTSFLLTALLGTTAKPTFDKELNLVASITLDLDHLRHGARIRLEAVEHNEDGVVDFISQRKDGVSEYFVEFIGCEAIARLDVQGRLLHTALDDWARETELSDDAKSQLMGQAYSHWQESRREKRPLTLTGIANALQPEDPQRLLDHLTHPVYGLAGQFFPPPPETMKRFVRFAFSGDGLKLEFDRNQWSNRIKVNAQRRTLTIRDVPDDLITALNEGA